MEYWYQPSPILFQNQYSSCIKKIYILLGLFLETLYTCENKTNKIIFLHSENQYSGFSLLLFVEAAWVFK